MTETDEKLKPNQAQSVLQDLAETRIRANRLVTPPISICAICSVLCGILVFSWASTDHGNLWGLGFYASMVSIILVYIFYLYSARLLGVKPRVFPRNTQEWLVTILITLSFAVMLQFTRELTLRFGVEVTYIGSTINIVIMFFVMRHYSSWCTINNGAADG